MNNKAPEPRPMDPINERDMEPESTDVGSTHWKKKWTIALIFTLIIGLTTIGILSYYLNDELNED